MLILFILGWIVSIFKNEQRIQKIKIFTDKVRNELINEIIIKINHFCFSVLFWYYFIKTRSLQLSIKVKEIQQS
jgi:hypothetical protein